VVGDRPQQVDHVACLPAEADRRRQLGKSGVGFAEMDEGIAQRGAGVGLLGAGADLGGDGGRSHPMPASGPEEAVQPSVHNASNPSDDKSYWKPLLLVM